MSPLILLKLISPKAWLVAATMALVLFGVYKIHSHGYAAGMNEVYAKWGAAEIVRAQTAKQAESDARAEEQRRAAVQREVLDEHERMAIRSRTETADLAAAAERQRERYAALASGGAVPGNPAAAGASAPADAALLVCSQLLGRADERLRSLAQFADASQLAGATCSASYDALTDPALTPAGTRSGLSSAPGAR